MKIVLFCNNRVGAEVAGWLAGRVEIVGVVVHPERRRKWGKEILAACAGAKVFDAATLRDAGTQAGLRSLRADIGVSVYFGYILKPDLLSVFPRGCVNLHPAYLPYNRGVYPNVWSIVDGTPAGATLHFIDSGIDTGDIIAQRRVEVEPVDTGETLHRKLEETALALFREHWAAVASGKAPRKAQPKDGTFHTVADADGIDEIRLDETVSARRLIDVLRARTFPPYAGAYFVHRGRKVHLRLHLEYEKDKPK